MQRVARFHSVLEAQSAAAYLLRNGIPATVVSVPGDAALIMHAMGKGTHEVYAADRESAEAGLAMLEQRQHDEPAVLPEDWEDQSVPDLSKLPMAMVVPCPACGADARSGLTQGGVALPQDLAEVARDAGERDAGDRDPGDGGGDPLFDGPVVVGVCPVCHAIFDAVDAVVASHGPEALAGCYPDEIEDAISAKTLGSIRVPCLRCGYALDGLPTRGRCPECGLGYDKKAQLRNLIDRRSDGPARRSE